MLIGLLLVTLLLGLVLGSLAAAHSLQATLQVEPIRIKRAPTRRR